MGYVCANYVPYKVTEINRVIRGTVYIIYRLHFMLFQHQPCDEEYSTYTMHTTFHIIDINDKKDGCHITDISHSAFILNWNINLRLAHICAKIKTTTTFVSFIAVHLPETSMPATMHIYAIYLMGIYGAGMCIYVIHIKSLALTMWQGVPYMLPTEPLLVTLNMYRLIGHYTVVYNYCLKKNCLCPCPVTYSFVYK